MPTLDGLSPLRVCHIIHHLAPGGAERLLVELAGAAAAEQLELSVLSIMASDRYPYAANLRAHGVPVADLGGTNRWDPRSVVRGVRFLRDLKPDLLHTHLKHADIVGAVASARLGTPMVSTLHQIENSQTPIQHIKLRAGAWARMHQARRTIAVSDAQRSWYIGAFPVPPADVVTIRNGVTLPPPRVHARRRIRAEFGLSDECVVAVMLGVMRPGKGHEQLLRAVRLLGERSSVHVLLAGDGPLRPKLEETARTNGHHRVSFAGWRSDVSDLLVAADIVVHPTLFDALPTALIEALAAGRPSVASKVGGVPEIVTGGCGILVEPDRPEQLAAALTALAEDGDRRRGLGQRARERYEAEFSAAQWAARLRSLYDEVMSA